ncbi:MAG TPA: response regulator transcription factor [Acidimicrobiales bacterium]|nr:response regulator transcription factor [Acidimicrobiales bacterium]
MPGEAPNSSPAEEAGKRLLIVDDDEEVRRLVVRVLRSEGYVVEEASDVRSMREAIGRALPDLLVLDIMLGSEDGLEVLSTLRQRSDIPVILLTGKASEVDRVLGLKMGADDYVVKPFYPAELSARIATVLRRSSPPQGAPVLEYDELAIDVVTREVKVRGEPVDLTAKEFDLLAFLARSPRQVFTREQILAQVWESSSAWQDAATVTEHVRRIRRKIEENPDAPRWVTTARGVGYRFEP